MNPKDKTWADYVNTASRLLCESDTKYHEIVKKQERENLLEMETIHTPELPKETIVSSVLDIFKLKNIL